MNFELNLKDEITKKCAKKICVDKNCKIEVVLEIKKYDEIEYLEFSLNIPKGSK